MPEPSPLLALRPEGLYCAAGDFFVDPWRPVERAVITHAHADHARAGHRAYLASAQGERVLRARLGEIPLESLGWGERRRIGDVDVSLHPAGHVLGAAQVRLEHRGEVWVVSGDYRIEADVTCTPFEPVRCHTFVTESTFGLPVYRWRPQTELFDEIGDWWAANAAQGRPSVLFCYAFGKAQRILGGVDASTGPIVCHGAIETLNRAYRDSGIRLPQTLNATDPSLREDFGAALVLAPPSAAGSIWMRRFRNASDAFASGWMQLRGARRRRGVDRGFALSDHADWPGLQRAIRETGAQQVLVTHGYVPVMVRWLAEQGIDAKSLDTEFAGEAGAVDEAGGDEAGGDEAGGDEAGGKGGVDEHGR